MLPVLNIGPLALQVPGLALLLGLWLGWLLVGKTSQRFNIPPTLAGNLVFAGLVAAALGGRLAYAAEHLSIFTKSPESLWALNLSLWDLPGGILAAALVVAWLGSRNRVRWGSLLDALTPFFAILMIAISLADLASGDAYGEPARLPWSINLWGDWRHPTQVYALLAGLLIFDFAVLVPLGKISPETPPEPAGLLFLKFVAWSSAAQLLVGAFRADVTLIGGQVRAIQVYAWLVLAACLLLIGRLKKPRPASPR